MDESLQINMNLVFVDFYFSKTNQIFRDMDSQIRQSGFVRIQELRIWILKDSFCGILLKIREDL
jgi:hypothetical protein